MRGELLKITRPFHQFVVDVASHQLNKVNRGAVFLTGSRNGVPVALAKNLMHNNVVHDRTIVLHFRVEDIPRVPNFQKVETEKVAGGFYRIVVRYGFMELPRLDNVLALAAGQGLEIDPKKTSFFVGRENLVLAEISSMPRWRSNLFIFMSRNAADASSFFSLPANQVVEVGVRLAI